MKTLNIDFKLWVGDNIYYIDKGKIVETYVYKIEYNIIVDIPDLKKSSVSYILQNGNVITDKDISTIYFTNKKELIQHLISQL